jgi:pSer/pThr/pTyr-binding forkhead associated (FHA) protein
MSNSTIGSWEADFENGGAKTFRVPQGDTTVLSNARNEIQIWKCWSTGREWSCDPR